MSLFFRDLLVKILTPIVKLIGKCKAPFSHKKITGEQYYAWRDLIKPGDVILSTTYGELSNIINPSPLKHGGTYLGGDIVKYVGEALGKGYKKRDLVTHLTTKDIVVICRIKHFSFTSEELVKAFKKYEGLAYDYDFSSRNKALYCFEACAKLLEDLTGQKIKTFDFLGEKTYTCDSFLNNDMFTIILDSREM